MGKLFFFKGLLPSPRSALPHFHILFFCCYHSHFFFVLDLRRKVLKEKRNGPGLYLSSSLSLTLHSPKKKKKKKKKESELQDPKAEAIRLLDENDRLCKNPYFSFDNSFLNFFLP